MGSNVGVDGLEDGVTEVEVVSVGNFLVELGQVVDVLEVGLGDSLHGASAIRFDEQ